MNLPIPIAGACIRRLSALVFVDRRRRLYSALVFGACIGKLSAVVFRLSALLFALPLVGVLYL